MHARYFPLAFRVSAGNQEPGEELALEARSLRVTGGRASREGEARPGRPEPRGEARGGRRLHSPPPRATLPTPPHGTFIFTRPRRARPYRTLGAPALHGPGALIFPPASALAITPRPPNPPSAAGRARRPHTAPTTAPAPRSVLTVRLRRLRERTVRRRRRRSGPTAAAALYRAGAGGRTRPSPPRNARAARRERLNKTPDSGSQMIKTDTRAAFREVRTGERSRNELEERSGRWRVFQAAAEPHQKQHNRRRPGPLPAA